MSGKLGNKRLALKVESMKLDLKLACWTNPQNVCIHNMHQNKQLKYKVLYIYISIPIPPKFFAFANGPIIDMLPVNRSIRLKNGWHNLGKPIKNCSSSLRFTIICSTSEIEAFRDKRFMLKESVEVVSLLKIIFPTSESRPWQEENHYRSVAHMHV